MLNQNYYIEYLRNLAERCVTVAFRIFFIMISGSFMGSNKKDRDQHVRTMISMNHFKLIRSDGPKLVRADRPRERTVDPGAQAYPKLRYGRIQSRHFRCSTFILAFFSLSP